MALLLGVLSSFILGLVAGMGVFATWTTRHDLSFTALDKLLVALSLLAAFTLGAFISLILP